MGQQTVRREGGGELVSEVEPTPDGTLGPGEMGLFLLPFLAIGFYNELGWGTALGFLIGAVLSSAAVIVLAVISPAAGAVLAVALLVAALSTMSCACASDGKASAVARMTTSLALNSSPARLATNTRA